MPPCRQQSSLVSRTMFRRKTRASAQPMVTVRTLYAVRQLTKQIQGRMKMPVGGLRKGPPTFHHALQLPRVFSFSNLNCLDLVRSTTDPVKMV